MGTRRNSARSIIPFDSSRPLSILSSSTTRTVAIKQWLSNMRERGIIISDAEMRYIYMRTIITNSKSFSKRYRRWLTLSEASRPVSSKPARNLRPWTAPADLYPVQHTKTRLTVFNAHSLLIYPFSLLRAENLQPFKAETDYSLLLKKRKQFGNYCAVRIILIAAL